ncbi:MAG: ABC transporter permease [Chloroflexaceae bacterium]|nr:ABC transporter permease [Chloroflexaceae bacterium]
MGHYLLRRLLQMIPVLIGLTIIIFGVTRLRGDPTYQFVQADASQEEIDAVRRAYGFDRPLLEQYLVFAAGVLRGDFGESFRFRQPAMPLVLERVPATLTLTLSALLVAWLIALPTGLISALRQNSAIDLTATGISVIGRAMPNYWMGIMFILLFSVQLGWLPVSGTGDWRNLVIPSLTLGLGLATTLTRLIRSSMLEVIRQEYITTARAKGLGEWALVFRHALRNCLISVVTVFGLQIGWLLGGAVIVEQVFAWPGMGRLMLQAVYTRDLAVIQAGVFVSALLIMVINLIVDVSYTLLDPRIRY